MKEHVLDIAKLSPPATTVGLSVLGIPLQEWVYILTIAYTLLLILDKFFPEILPRIRALIKGVFR